MKYNLSQEKDNCFTEFHKSILGRGLAKPGDLLGTAIIIGFLNDTKEPYSQIILWNDQLWSVSAQAINGKFDYVYLLKYITICDMDK